MTKNSIKGGSALSRHSLHAQSFVKNYEKQQATTNIKQFLTIQLSSIERTLWAEEKKMSMKKFWCASLTSPALVKT